MPRPHIASRFARRDALNASIKLDEVHRFHMIPVPVRYEYSYEELKYRNTRPGGFGTGTVIYVIYHININMII